MSITKRQEQILALLGENTFLSVERLSELTYASPSSVRRDLSKLQNMYFIKRTHGGASILNEKNQPPSLDNRMTQNTIAKRKIAKKAAALLADGQVILLDGSSTAGFLLPYIAKHSDMTLFTNNMLTALNAINYGIHTHCIGGSSVNRSAVLSGAESYRTVSAIHADVFFFSSHSLSREGVISDPTEEENYLRSLMLTRADMRVFLCDSTKFGRESLYTLTQLNHVDTAVFDTPWDELQTECKLL